MIVSIIYLLTGVVAFNIELTESFVTSNFGLFSLLFSTVIINFSFYLIDTFYKRNKFMHKVKADISRLCSDVNLKIVLLKNK
jgi:uncharacterized membrane-anchored protein